MDRYTAVANGVALVAATAKTVLQIATPSTIRARIVGISITLDGVTAGNVPGLLELVRQTSAGTGGTSVTPGPVDGGAPASLCTAVKNCTAEPTGPTVLRNWTLSPNGGVFVIPFYGDDRPIVPISGFTGIRCTFANVVNVAAEIWFLS